jgi:cation diffusion facilitator CzcD-associated flavoprotein CzcO
MSLAVTGFPNLFLMCGPATIFANGNLLAGMEDNADYIVAAMIKMQRQDYQTMEIRQEVQDEYNVQQEGECILRLKLLLPVVSTDSHLTPMAKP